jgi:hypothetical protein
VVSSGRATSPEGDVSTVPHPGEQTVSFPLPSDAVAKLRARAADRGLALEAYLRLVTERAAEAPEPDADGPAGRLEHELAWLTGRSAEDVAEARRRLLALSPPARPIPEGKTLSDVVEGQWPGDETDEQVRAALERLS